MVIKEGQLIEIEWLDAVDTTLCDKELKLLLDDVKDGREFLAVNSTFGKLGKILDNVVIIITEESTASDTEVTIIPRGWISEPEELFKK